MSISNSNFYYWTDILNRLIFELFCLSRLLALIYYHRATLQAKSESTLLRRVGQKSLISQLWWLDSVCRGILQFTEELIKTITAVTGTKQRHLVMYSLSKHHHTYRHVQGKNMKLMIKGSRHDPT